MSQNKYRIDMRISIRNTDYSGSGLDINETLEIPTQSFLEMAKILGRFHDLSEQIRKEQTK